MEATLPVRSRLVAAALAGVGVLVAPPAAHALLMPLSTSELCAIADAVVIAEITSGEVAWAQGARGGIVTRRWAAVQRVVVGDAPATLEIVLPGGEIGDLRQWVEDVPELREDERYVLFLRRQGDGTWTTLGGEAANTPVQRPEGGPGERYVDALLRLEVCRAP